MFIGISTQDYARLVGVNAEAIDAHYITGSNHSVAAGRLSYLLGLHGPSLALDTACSSSLVALHLACESLRAEESHLALVGGVNLILTPETSINFSRNQMLAADDRCKTFDARADGYVRGEGGGVIVLKRLSAALADQDTILAVIRGSAVNQDGRSGSLTAPNGLAQTQVIRAALKQAQLEPSDLDYVETHGTGTRLGDPIEVQALAEALETSGRRAALPIGSVKTNIGHLEAAAGLAGLMKVILILQHQEIPPHLHLTEPSPYIAWDDLRVSVPTRRTALPAGEKRLVAGVSAFGFSGTNAHVIVEAAPPVQPNLRAETHRQWHLLSVSARSEAALRDQAQRVAQFLTANPAVTLADVACTLSSGRAHLTQRLALVAASPAEAQQKLSAFAQGQTVAGLRHGLARGPEWFNTAFLFSGQEALAAGMGGQLYETEAVFRETLDRCDQWVRDQLGQPLLSAAPPESRMAYAQPALYALQCALVELWRSWGIAPDFVLGHSLGEYAAAYAAGVLDLYDGLRLVALRGRLMDALPARGHMVAVFATEAQVRAWIAAYAGQISIAAINGPEHLVISGDSAALDTLCAALRDQGVHWRRLAVAVAAHSPVVAPILDEFAAAAREIHYAEARIPIISGLRGALLTTRIDADYWCQHTVETVRFADAMRAAAALGCNSFIDIGPGGTLLSMGQRGVPESEALWLPSLRDSQSPWPAALDSLAALYVSGADLRWKALNEVNARRSLPLPTYPWERTRYWPPVAPRPAPARTWDSLVTAGQAQAQQGPLDLALHRYPEKWQRLNAFARASIVQTLRGLGTFGKAGKSYTVDALCDVLRIAPMYRRLLARWLDMLAEQGLLEQTGTHYAAAQPLPEPQLDAARMALRDAWADSPPLVAYVERCSQALGMVITGQSSALETVFPGGSFETVEFLYHDWPMARYFNAIVAALVKASVDPSAAHVLEVGAGVGGTTAALLPLLPGAAYDFTDVSEFFLAHAREKFRTYPNLRCGLLDIERPPDAQGYAAHNCDVVIAANVLHATRRLDETLAHVRQLLAPGGTLILYETTEHPDWLDITQGLTEGWQRFDDGLRAAHPLLETAQWQALLAAQGFSQTAVFPEDKDAAEGLLGQRILAARLPGTPEARPVIARIQEPETQALRPGDAAPPFTERWALALPRERYGLMLEVVSEHLRAILRLDDTRVIGKRERLLDLGLDSLLALELKTRLRQSLGLEQTLPSTLIFDHPTLEALARYLMIQIEGEVQTADEDPLAGLADAEIEALLLKKLKGLENDR